MEDRSRSFEPVHIGMTSVEAANERFQLDQGIQPPAVAYWRVNLTALSQKYNLYFVAIRDAIQVYKPSFPYQTLGNRPALTIIPQLAYTAARGYIDTRQPHNVDHLVVGDLGSQEILLLATDSGNVVAYHTGSIDAAIDRDAYKFSNDGNADFVGVRPFFSQWVYESAWGLAIHKEGRMIAVSANTPHCVTDYDLTSKITVFAFALTASTGSDDSHTTEVDIDTDSIGDPSEWKIWTVTDHALHSDVPTRGCNYKIILGGPDGHQNNVPCVTFMNSAEDLTGSWLLSTDIKGQMKLWQIWKGRCSTTWDFSNQGDLATPWTNHREPGWVVAALDISSFRPAESMEKFVGNHRPPQYQGYHASGDSYDLTSTVRRFTPQNSLNHPLLTHDNDDGVSDEEPDELFDATFDSGDETANASQPSFVFAASRSTYLSEQPPAASNDAKTNLDRHHDDHSVVGSDDDSDFFAHELGDDIETEDLDDEFEHATSSFSLDVDERQLPSDARSENSPPSFNSMRGTSRRSPTGTPSVLQSESPSRHPMTHRLPWPRKRSGIFLNQTKPNDQTRLPSVPILHCSDSHVRLFTGSTARYPHIFCARMLRQVLPVELERTHLSHLDRLSMLHQIPELGIVLIATQLGRCAICSLTRRSRDGLLGFRVDWIVPTKKQERDNVRPANCVLIGIAASPIQGHASLRHHQVSESDAFHKRSYGRSMDGTFTSFDSHIVVLSKQSEEQLPDISLESSGPRQLHTRTENREWVSPDQYESWKAYESHRRYRVMLTYSDMTVLTYELSRGVEGEDIAAHSELDSLD